MQDFIDDELDDNLDDLEPIVDNPTELYEHFRVEVDKGQKQALKAHAESRGETLNGFVNRAIQETLERDNGGSSNE